MARFPDDPAPTTPYAWRVSLPLARGGPGWAQRTRQLVRSPLHSVDLAYRSISWDQVQTLFAFWQAHVNGTFAFADFNGFVKGGNPSPGVEWVGLYVGKGTGSLATWTLPTFEIAASPAPIIYVGGVVKTCPIATSEPGSGDGWIHVGAGDNGLDKLLFRSGHEPAEDAILQTTATCRRALPSARFGTDDFPFQVMNPRVISAGTLQILEDRG